MQSSRRSGWIVLTALAFFLLHVYHRCAIPCTTLQLGPEGSHSSHRPSSTSRFANSASFRQTRLGRKGNAHKCKYRRSLLVGNWEEGGPLPGALSLLHNHTRHTHVSDCSMRLAGPLTPAWDMGHGKRHPSTACRAVWVVDKRSLSVVLRSSDARKGRLRQKHGRFCLDFLSLPLLRPRKPQYSCVRLCIQPAFTLTWCNDTQVTVLVPPDVLNAIPFTWL